MGTANELPGGKPPSRPSEGGGTDADVQCTAPLYCTAKLRGVYLAVAVMEL